MLLIERRLVPPDQLERALYGERVGFASSPSAAALPQRFGEFVVSRELDRGGMGAVLEVRGPTGHRLALKTLLPGGVGDAELVARFRREAELTARLDHPHVVRIHAADLDANPPYLVVDLLPGGTLKDRIGRAGGLPLNEALAITSKLVSALQHAHARGVLHRDLKPENVLFDDRGEPRIIDWGLARSLGEVSEHLTRTGTLLGTPAYMAPEQALAEVAVGAPADVYSLGALFYAQLCGSPPFEGALLATLDKVIHQTAPAPSASADLGELAVPVDALVARLLAKDLTARPTLEELAEELRRLLRGEHDTIQRTARWRWALVGAAALLLLGGVLLFAVQSGPAFDPQVAYQEHLEWERESLGTYGLDAAPIPSAAALDRAQERLDRVGATLDAPGLVLNRQRLGAYRGLLALAADEPPPQVEGVPGQLLKGVAALRAGKTSTARRYAEGALRGASADPERFSAQLLLLETTRNAADLEQLASRLRLPAGGPLARGFRVTAERLLAEALSGFPGPREPWRRAADRIGPALALAKLLGVSRDAWWRGFSAALPNWKARLARVATLEQADELSQALVKLNPPGLGPGLRRLFQDEVQRLVRLNEALSSESVPAAQRKGRRGRARRALRIAFSLDDVADYLDPSYELTPDIAVIVRNLTIPLDAVANSELVGAGCLFSLRHGAHSTLAGTFKRFDEAALITLDRLKPRPLSQARGLALIQSTYKGSPSQYDAAGVSELIRRLTETLARERKDLSPHCRGQAELWLADLYSNRASRPGADAAGDQDQAAASARRAIRFGFPARIELSKVVDATRLVVLPAKSRGEYEDVLRVWAAALGAVREGYHAAGGDVRSAAAKNTRLALVRALCEVGMVRLMAHDHSIALSLGREIERLTKTRSAWAEWLPWGYLIQATALQSMHKNKEAWTALHVDEDLFGYDVTYATLVLTLGVKVGEREAAQRAYHGAFLKAVPLREIRERRSLRLDPRERQEVTRIALEQGYPLPPMSWPEAPPKESRKD